MWRFHLENCQRITDKERDYSLIPEFKKNDAKVDEKGSIFSVKNILISEKIQIFALGKNYNCFLINTFIFFKTITSILKYFFLSQFKYLVQYYYSIS